MPSRGEAEQRCRRRESPPASLPSLAGSGVALRSWPDLSVEPRSHQAELNPRREPARPITLESTGIIAERLAVRFRLADIWGQKPARRNQVFRLSPAGTLRAAFLRQRRLGDVHLNGMRVFRLQVRIHSK